MASCLEAETQRSEQLQVDCDGCGAPLADLERGELPVGAVTFLCPRCGACLRLDPREALLSWLVLPAVERALDAYIGSAQIGGIRSGMGAIAIHESRLDSRKRHPELYTRPERAEVRASDPLMDGTYPALRHVVPVAMSAQIVQLRHRAHAGEAMTDDERLTIAAKLGHITSSERALLTRAARHRAERKRLESQELPKHAAALASASARNQPEAHLAQLRAVKNETERVLAREKASLWFTKTPSYKRAAVNFWLVCRRHGWSDGSLVAAHCLAGPS